MTDTQIAALRETVGRMTPGEWQANGSHFYGPDPVRLLVGQCLYPMGDKSNDIAGIVALRNTALPIIDALEAERDAKDARIVELEGALREAVMKAHGCDEIKCSDTAGENCICGQQWRAALEGRQS
jgi:hypothetical protein